MREDRLSVLLLALSQKEEVNDTDTDNTLVQKFISPLDYVTVSDSSAQATVRPISAMCWGGYDNDTYYAPGWLWGQGGQYA